MLRIIKKYGKPAVKPKKYLQEILSPWDCDYVLRSVGSGQIPSNDSVPPISQSVDQLPRLKTE